MVGAPQTVRVTILPPSKRREDNDVRAQFNPAGAPAGPPAGRGGPGTPRDPKVLTPNQVNERFDQFLVLKPLYPEGSGGSNPSPSARQIQPLTADEGLTPERLDRSQQRLVEFGGGFDMRDVAHALDDRKL